ncbi:MAG: anion permease [Clostridia bacterium]|nr:anion permease [Clostridia bacterium]
MGSHLLTTASVGLEETAHAATEAVEFGTPGIVALVIFLIMFALVITEKIEKHITTLICGGAMMLFVFGFAMGWRFDMMWSVGNLESMTHLGFWYGHSDHGAGIDWATIIFLAGMMIMVEGMAKAGFFRWLCMTLAKLVKYKVLPIFLVFMIMSACLAMFIDSITVILFLAAVTIELAHLLKFNPVPMILSEIFCANLGGSATMCGDPPNIIIGSALNLSFFDFLSNTGLIAGVSLVFIVLYFFLCFRKEYKAAGKDIDVSAMPDPKSVITDMRGFFMSIGIFLIVVVLLVTHSMTMLSVATIGVIAAVITLLANLKGAKHILKLVDYKTLLFFVGLFIVVGGMQNTGVLKLIADAIAVICGDNLLLMVAIIIWVSGIASAFVDNIPFATIMVPIIETLSGGQTTTLHTLAYSLAMGTDIGGSATPIGASANVVGVSVASKAGYPIGWGRYCKYMAPATVIVMLISTGMVWLMFGLI